MTSLPPARGSPAPADDLRCGRRVRQVHGAARERDHDAGVVGGTTTPAGWLIEATDARDRPGPGAGGRPGSRARRPRPLSPRTSARRPRMDRAQRPKARLGLRPSLHPTAADPARAGRPNRRFLPLGNPRPTGKAQRYPSAAGHRSVRDRRRAPQRPRAAAVPGPASPQPVAAPIRSSRRGAEANRRPVRRLAEPDSQRSGRGPGPEEGGPAPPTGVRADAGGAGVGCVVRARCRWVRPPRQHEEPLDPSAYAGDDWSRAPPAHPPSASAAPFRRDSRSCHPVQR